MEALTTLGRVDQAKALLDAVLTQAGPTGVFTEQFDDWTGTALGNLPQAYSHLGLISAVLRLEPLIDGKRAEAGAALTAKERDPAAQPVKDQLSAGRVEGMERGGSPPPERGETRR
ncbi:MAG: hypothetical protein QM783_17875 [Phycisphaerales bacterium]